MFDLEDLKGPGGAELSSVPVAGQGEASNEAEPAGIPAQAEVAEQSQPPPPTTEEGAAELPRLPPEGVPFSLFCGICGEIFKNRKAKKCHTHRVHQGNTQWTCPKCSQTFSFQINLNRH